MSKFDTKMTAVADEIRRLAKVSGSLTLDDMAGRLEKVEVGGIDTSDATATSQDLLSGKTAYVNGNKITGTISTEEQATPAIGIDENGLITASSVQETGYVVGGTKSATQQLDTQEAVTITPTKNSQTVVTIGKFTTGDITVNAIPSEYIVPNGTTTITTNGTHDVTSYASATVNVELPELSNPASEEEVFANKQFIDENGEVITGTFTIDNELNTQENLINQITTALEGKAVTTPTLQEKTVSPSTSVQTVKPDSGYDGLSQVTVNAMTTATQATPSISVSSSGLITASTTQSEGYVGSGIKSATKQLTTQAAKTITPSISSQTAVASGVYTTGAITVGAIPSTYVKPTTKKSATTYTPTTSNQTIAAGTYCSGTQTIKGDANLKAENIAEGVSIFGVAGTHSGGGSGGGSVETCTVTIAELFMDELVNFITTTVVENGIEKPYVIMYPPEDYSNAPKPPYIIQNVKCGALINVIRYNHYGGNPYVETHNGSISIGSCRLTTDLDAPYLFVFTAPTTANANSTIIVDFE